MNIRFVGWQRMVKAEEMLKSFLLAGFVVLGSLACSNAIDGNGINYFLWNSGANLPWGYNHTGGYSRYGWDFGKNPWGGANEGFSFKRPELEQDLSYLKSKNVKVVRDFVFCDFRTGLNYDGSGNIIGVQTEAYADMRTLVDVARTNNVKIIPVLMDYTIADGLTCQGGLGEHPEFITNSLKRAQLLTVMRPFARELGTNSVVAIMEVMNEPEVGVGKGIVSQISMKSFLLDFANMIKEECPNTPVTIGHYNWQGYSDPSSLDDYGNTSCNLTEIHYYSSISPYWSYNTPATNVYTNSVFFGELEPTDELNKMNQALSNGYGGVLFWSLHDKYAGIDFSTISGNYSNWISSEFAYIHKDMKLTGLCVSNNTTLNLSPVYERNTYCIEGSTNLLNWTTLTNIQATSSMVNCMQIRLPKRQESNYYYRCKAIF